MDSSERNKFAQILCTLHILCVNSTMKSKFVYYAATYPQNNGLSSEWNRNVGQLLLVVY